MLVFDVLGLFADLFVIVFEVDLLDHELLVFVFCFVEQAGEMRMGVVSGFV